MLMTVSHFPNGEAQALSESITCSWSHGFSREVGGSCMISYLTHVLSPMLELLLLFFFFWLEDHCFPERFNYLLHIKSQLTKATRLSHLWLPMTNPSFIVLHNSWHLKPLVLVIKCLFPCLHCLVQQREMPVLTTDECHGEHLRFSSGSFRHREKFTETPLSTLSP